MTKTIHSSGKRQEDGYQTLNLESNPFPIIETLENALFHKFATVPVQILHPNNTGCK